MPATTFEQTRQNVARQLVDQDLHASLLLGGAFLVTALILAFTVDSARQFEPLTMLLLVAGYAVASRVDFEIGTGYASPTQLVLVPMFVLLPVPFAPLFVLAGLLLGGIPEYARGRVPASRSLLRLVNPWHAVGPALILLAAGRASSKNPSRRVGIFSATPAPAVSHPRVWTLSAAMGYVARVTLALARRFIEAVDARDFEAAERCLHPDVETVTPRGTVRGVVAWRQVLEKATTGYENVNVERTEPEFEEIDGDVLARTHEVGRWRETEEVAYERDFAVRLTFDGDKIIRNVVLPGGASPSGNT